MRFYHKKLISLILFICINLPSILFSQSNILKFEHISIEHGLSQNSVYCIFQDSKGFMWFGTENGLNRYDGHSFKIYKHVSKDPFSISDNMIFSIFEDLSGILWVGTRSGGLNKFDRETDRFTHYRNDPDDLYSLINNSVYLVYEDRSDDLWISTRQGLNKFDRETGRFFRYQNDQNDPGSLSSNFITSICEDQSGMLWLGTTLGLNKFDKESGRFFRYFNDPDDLNSLSSNYVRSVCIDRSGLLWIGTYGEGINKFDQKTGRFTRYRNDPENPNSLNDNNIRSIYEDQTGVLWIGTTKGLNKFDHGAGRFTHYRSDPDNPNSLNNNSIWTIYEDKSGVLWIGTRFGGINKINREMDHFNHYRNVPGDPNSINGSFVRSIYEDRSGVPWIGMYEAGLNKFDRETERFIHYLHDPDDPNSLSGNKVRSVYEDKSSVLWIGTTVGLNKYNRETDHFTRYRNDPDDPNSLSGSNVFSILEDRSGILWLGTTNGLNKFDRKAGRFTRYMNNQDDPESISGNFISSIYEDRSGTLWISTSGRGLNRFDRETESFIHYLHDPDNLNSLSTNFVFSVYEDSSGVLWIGTNNGLNKFDKSRSQVTHYMENDGLSDNAVYGILEDGHCNLWLSTNKGLSKFDPENETFKNYDVNDGLQSNEFNDCAYFEGRNGEMYFGGINGFNLFHPDSIRDNPHLPQLVITDFQLINKSVPVGEMADGRTLLTKNISETKAIELTYEDRVFSFEFAALEFTDPEENEYAYMMEGFENKWNYIGHRRFATYTNLPHGEYVFRVKASNNDGIWNEEGISLKIKITPPFWKTVWFKLSAFIFIFALAYFSYKIRVKNINQHRKKLKNLLDERTVQASELSKAYKSLKIEIMERKLVEEEKAKLEEQFFHTQKMESIGRLAGGIAHDFNNILTSIIGYAEMLKGKFQNTATLEGKASEVIFIGAERAASLTGQLLSFARKDDFQTISLDVNRIIKNAFKIMENILEKKVDTHFIFNKDRIIIEADESQLNQVFTNLIVNAKDALPDGGEIIFKTDKVFLGKNDIKKMPDLEEGYYAFISFKDNGTGIPVETAKKIFDPFFTTKEKGKGTGLGLATVYTIIKNHKGRITVNSKQGEGTEFLIYLPVSEKEVLKEKNVDILKAGKGTVLIIDDEENVRDLAASQLESLGYDVILAEDGEKGIEIYISQKDNIDLVLLDIIMPKIDGRKTNQLLMKTNPGVKVILMSGYSKDGISETILNEGAMGFIQKPFRLQDLSEAVAEALKT